MPGYQCKHQHKTRGYFFEWIHWKIGELHSWPCNVQPVAKDFSIAVFWCKAARHRTRNREPLWWSNRKREVQLHLDSLECSSRFMLILSLKPIHTSEIEHFLWCLPFFLFAFAPCERFNPDLLLLRTFKTDTLSTPQSFSIKFIVVIHFILFVQDSHFR